MMERDSDNLKQRALRALQPPAGTAPLPDDFVERLRSVTAESGDSARKPFAALRWAAGLAAAAVLAGVVFLLREPAETGTGGSGEAMATAKVAAPQLQARQEAARTQEGTRPMLAASTERHAAVSLSRKAAREVSSNTLDYSAEAAVLAAEAEAERVIAATEAEAEARIEAGNREELISSTEAQSAAFIADVEAVLAFDVAATERQARAAAYNGQMLANK